MNTPADNAQVARRWFEEVWNQHRTETIYELLLPDSVGHTESGDMIGPKPFADFHAAFVKALPQIQITVEDTVAEGDQVVVRWTASGHHHGDCFGCPPTGKQVRFRGMTWFRMRDGKFAEGWDAWNMGGLMEQLRT